MKKATNPNPFSTPRRHDFHRPPPPTHGCGWTPRPVHHRPYHQWRPRFQPHAARIDRPPEPYFRVELRLGRCPLHRDDVEALIDECRSSHDSFTFYPTDDVAAVLNYRSWEQARDAVVWFWEARLAEKHDFTPALDSNVVVVKDDVDCRLRPVFARHVKGLMMMEEGKEVKFWMDECERLAKEISRLSSSLSKPLRIGTQNELMKKKKGLVDEKNLVERRLKEFESAMQCLLKYLEDGGDDVEGVKVFRFDGGFDWKRIHCLIKRECRRLEDGLPIYAYRRDILQEIHYQQIMVLIGATGSGKSTQLVQFLADSGVGSDESIVCTQPRKIAAKAVAQRVQQESSGCYEGQSIKYCSTFLSSREFDSRITFMTDHSLLQHYMSDNNLSGVSCIIIDEAHERSLNTDFLLTLLKSLLCRRVEMRLIIMSATADAKQLSDYFFGCGIFHVLGRSFPVDIKYVPSDCGGDSGSAVVASYVSDVVRMATEIHKTEKEGTILAFLTSQIEVEWACEKFQAASAVALPLHGKLSSDEQFRVFQNYPGKRKVIFSTNLAETSLTIPGVRYVIDSGLVKDSRFDPSSGMSVLKVCWISQSSADQRAGRAGRTEPGVCYRMYLEADYQSMDLNTEPEIRKVHLGVAVLRILALGVKDMQDFDFVDAPSPSSIDMAIRNLIQLGAIELNNNAHDLTSEGWCLVRMGIEPRLGKLILGCFKHGLGREGIILAAVMANASSIFCRVGSEFDKQRSDCLKVQFCHCDGDLFTLLSVYKEWEALPRERKNKWCWENSINAKSIRRCQDTILELETCLEREHDIVTPSYWLWDPCMPSNHDKNLKRVILSSLVENVAMYSGCNQLGYEVAQTGQHVQLHPSCSLLVFAEKPSWVVFGELLSISNQYLVCVCAFDFQSLFNLCPAPLFDVSKMEERKLLMKTLSGLGCILLKRFCGKANCDLLALVSRIRKACMDERIFIEVNVDKNEIHLYATSNEMDIALGLVNGVLEYERKLLRTECMDKFLYHGSGFSPPVALFGSGAEIKHLELEKRSLSVDVCHPNINEIDDRELLMFFEKNTSGCICAVHKFTGNMRDGDRDKWGRIIFMSPDVVRRAAELDGQEFCGSSLKIVPSQLGWDKTFSFPAVKARISWPRRLSRGFAIVKCDIKDVNYILRDFYNLAVGGRYVRCEIGKKSIDSVVINGLDKELSEAEIVDVLRTATSRRILDFFLVRGDAAGNPPCSALEEALLKEIYPFLPKRNPHIIPCRVQVFAPEPKDSFMRALITFDGRLHLEAAKALEQIEGKVLPGCLSWQKIKCQQLFHSSIIFPTPVYHVIKEQLDEVLASFRNLKGLECNLGRTVNGSHRVKITANATRTVAEVRRPLEELLRGKTIEHDSLTPVVFQLMLSRDGFSLKNSLQQETGTYILFDRHNLNLRVFGSPNKVALAQEKVIQSLLSLHEEKQLEIHLRGMDLPPDLMKQMIKNFGPDLRGLKEKVPGVDLTLNTRRHIVILHGSKELKPRVEEIIFEIARSSHHLVERFENGPSCPICLCEVEDGYRLEGCGHLFCGLCLVEQFESAINNQGTFPVCCTHRDCGDPILLTDLRSLLFGDKLEDLFRASLGAFVATSGGAYRFCPSPDCPSIYRVADPESAGEPFVCGACYSETCTRCHLEYHPYLSCERYQEFKEDPDSSLKEWCRGKEQVKCCSACGYVIEKVDGCNHVECKCGKHVCWVCLEFFSTSNDCYNHLRTIHLAII
ncbi:ATP-dependent RNA helicase DEAH12, chloroplastic-like [Glycine soja]|uniref:RNA helicase n=1 Tax=Glycine soja TaxID=3848 RepID=A0A445HHU7_GLYSO|nr:ATP-dependent RNA helicase DEAH12, chloroplastic-like [Glycine soja]RZB73200.1 ATP-dependent RNA helicase DEAH12, chloroplastic [Glycine soja]